MHRSLVQLLLNCYLIATVLDQYSTILCDKSLQLNQKNGNGNQKKAGKGPQAAPNKQVTQMQSPANKDTTISKMMSPHGKEWHYGENWPEHGFDICGQTSQSPIRLNTGNAERDSSLHLQLFNYNRDIRRAFVENNGHTVGFSDNFKASIQGSATGGQRFIFAQMHFHWGSYNGVGSEHTVDGYRGPMEVHIVHYNAKYGSLDNSVTEEDGLMVLGALFQISSRDNRGLRDIISMVRRVPKYKDKDYLMGSFRLRQLLPARLRPFFMYRGSLTTPPCYETVQWLVFKHPVPIGDFQEKQFRKCRNEKINENNGRKRTISNNYRPVQAINERQITISS